jgi:hypothetical protein
MAIVAPAALPVLPDRAPPTRYRRFVATAIDLTIMAAAGPYLGMLGGPAVLEQVQEKARTVLRTGWRPPYAEGPNRRHLAQLVPVQPAT